MPLFFSTNLIFGRGAVGAVEPFTLAFLRWVLTFLILLPFVFSSLRQHIRLLSASWRYLLVQGFLGMWVCGALVYLALKYTSATNAVLIYTSSPVIIIMIEWLFRGRKIGLREAIGVGLAFAGVLIIITKGQLSNLTGLEFNSGDLIFVGAAIAWAIYSVALKSPRYEPLQTLPLFALDLSRINSASCSRLTRFSFKFDGRHSSYC